MNDGRSPQLLTINTGSSSVKVALFRVGAPERRELTVQAERIGLPDGTVRIQDAQGRDQLAQTQSLPDHEAALRAILGRLQDEGRLDALGAVGHRVVHGGRRYRTPHRITDRLLAALEQYVPLAPDHLPQAIAAIRGIQRIYPHVPQVACFDTAFHRHMPDVARQYALPRRLTDAGVIRYGFHGLSCEYIMHELRALDRTAARGRVVIAHLGNGASMTAVRGGVGVDTTMGFTPAGGLVMGTRPGDLDPGVPIYLLQAEHMDAAALNRLVNQESGLLGSSGTSADMRDLLDREATDERAAQAVALFCYQARKFLGALAAVLGGIETLVFTGGIGEHAAPIRRRICSGLEFLGIELDPQRNDRHAPMISRDGSPVTVRVIATDEERMIARHTARLIRQRGATHVSV